MLHAQFGTCPRIMHEVRAVDARWYHRSWKGNLEKAGGVATNIGVHFFDMLGWIFGGPKSSVVHRHQEDCAAGVLELAAPASAGSCP